MVLPGCGAVTQLDFSPACDPETGGVEGGVERGMDTGQTALCAFSTSCLPVALQK